MSKLLDTPTHDPTEVLEVLEAMQKSDKAFFDEKKMVRRVPIFEYDPLTHKPNRIARWQERKVMEIHDSKDLTRCQELGYDYYHEKRGWIRGGKKAERDRN